MALADVLRSPATPIVGGAVVVAALVVGAVVAPGYDAQQVDRVETSVWVARSAGQYARLNTELGQIDTVRSVTEPSAVAQSGSAGVVLGLGDRQFWSIDPATPADLVADAAADTVESGSGLRVPSATAQSTPAGTRDVVGAGDWLLFVTDVGEAYVGSIAPGAGGSVAFTRIDPFEDDPDGDAATVDAGAVSADGEVALYSADDGAVRVVDAVSGAARGGPQSVPQPPAPGVELQLTFVGERWVLLAPASGELWVEGGDGPIALDVAADAVLQQAGAADAGVLVADSAGLVRVDLGTGEWDRVTAASGVPAAPVEADGVRYAAWLSESGGTMWRSDTGESIALAVDGDVLESVPAIVPALRTNGDRAVLNEMSSGMLWLVPSGELIPLSEWDVDDTEQDADEQVTVDDASTQLPPTAEPDSFGVRAGSVVSLPVLFNDHDPNRADVLSVVPDSISGGLADAGFGSLGLVGQNQTIAVTVTADSGSTTFSYAVTDGLASSAPAQVTVTVIPDDENSAPVWCGVADCTQTWPSPQLAAGGTITVPVLDGWVDPDGDPFVLADAVKVDPTAPISVVPTSDGRVAIRHTDPNAAAQTTSVMVTVMDSRGATTERELVVQISAAPSLELRPSTVLALVGTTAVFDIDTAVTGGSGSYRLVDATDASVSSGRVTVLPNAADGTIAVTASVAGEYTISYSVQDAVTLAERSSTLRVSVTGSPLPLATAPLTAFVRAGEDATVGVLDAVANTTGRVLVVVDVEASSPQLSTSVVGQTQVRVSGSTSDGLPGPIGTVRYRVTDGAGAWTEGTIDVFLVAPSRDVSPIAVQDVVTVRAGAQVDIPVLANDVSPRGERLTLDPLLVGSGADGELAFVSGTLVRYLAPTVPGTYTLTYSAAIESSPTRLAAATITVTVIGDGVNRAPAPRALTARVLAGHTVEIPVSLVGIDPDGDAVRLVDIVQPAAGSGSAVIAASGTSIVYRAPAGGVTGGQVSFEYTVRDDGGETGTARVQVGVLNDELADLTPVTFGDAVRVQVGSPAPLTVLPVANDRDPAQGTLELVSLVPNVPTSDPEYARLESLIGDDTDLADGVVSLSAGDVIGTHSYVYTVRSTATTSTAQGLIVVTVAADAAPDRPVVTDTVVDLSTRQTLEQGIDVVAGKVTWVAGDVGDLTLSLWGASGRYRVAGTTIIGTAPTDGDLVPFQLTGLAPDGTEVSAYGFLRIPAFDDMRVQLRGGLTAISVGEEASAAFSVADVVLVDEADRLEVRDDVDFAVQRANSSCVAVGDGRVSYTAGREAPWSDTCSVAVRVAGQQTWSIVVVPVSIVPKAPQAVLGSISRTVSPGAVDTVGLIANLTSWEGGREGDPADLDYAISYSGTSFVVEQHGSTVSIQAMADAVPGTREQIRVSVSNFGGLSATITAVVGIAPSDAPRGATVSQRCTVTSASCTIQVVGVAGEYDPFAGRPGGGLAVVSVLANTGCTVASVAVSGTTQLVATWPSTAKPAGSTCSFDFTVRDAQGRLGTGLLVLDVQGYPAQPSSIVTTAYSATSVQLTVRLGDAPSQPAITGVAVYTGGAQVGSCAAVSAIDYQCTISGLTHGDKRFYTARAVNAVGESLETTAVESWAFAPPTITSVTPVNVYRNGTSTTSDTTGFVQLTVVASADAGSIRVDGVLAGGSFANDGAPHIVTAAAGAAVPMTVVAISAIQPPMSGQSNEGASATISPVVYRTPSYAGAPSVTVGTAETDITVTAAALDTGFAPAATEVRYLAGLTTPQCSATASGGLQVTPDAGLVTSDTGSFTGLTPNRTYLVRVCASTGFGVAASAVVTHHTFVAPPAPTGTLTYEVATTPTVSGRTSTWDLVTAPSVDALSDFAVEYTLYGTTSSSFWLQDDAYPSASVRYCSLIDPTRCGPSAAISPVTGGAPTSVQIVMPDSCSLLGTADDTAALVRAGISPAARYVADIEAVLGVGQWEITVDFAGTDFAALGAITDTCPAI